MDIPNTLTVSQFILIISLFTLLIGWLITFTYLALRPTPEPYIEPLEHLTTLPAIKSPETQTLSFMPRASGICTITDTEQTPIVMVSADATREMVLDHARHY